MARQICLTISYDGTSYCGFQIQPNGVSVEGVLNGALSKIAGHEVKIFGASRTDAGVHAEGQRATFFLEGRIPTDHICNAVNGLLPGDIVVTDATEVPADFHCRHDAVGKHYRYTIRNASLTSPFDRHYSYYFPGALDLKKIEDALPLFFGEHDFRAFTAANSGREDFVRTLDLITVKREGDYVLLDFWGRGFLYKMVRSISGSLIDVGRGYFGKEVIEKALETGDRSVLSLTAPSKGLSLIKIYYNDEYELDKEKSLR